MLENITSFLCENPDVRKLLRNPARGGRDDPDLVRFIRMNFLSVVDEAQFFMDETNDEGVWRRRYLDAKSNAIQEQRWLSFLEDFDVFNQKLNDVGTQVNHIKSVIDAHACDQNCRRLKYYDAFHTGFGPFVQTLDDDRQICGGNDW